MHLPEAPVTSRRTRSRTRFMLAVPSAALALQTTQRRPSVDSWQRTRCGSPQGFGSIPTRWAADISAAEPPLPAYPRPILIRGGSSDRNRGDSVTWASLNGLWEWEPATTVTTSNHPPTGRTLSRSILVPFPIESCLSGVAPTSPATFVRRSWYRSVVSVRNAAAHSRLMLHFGAVIWNATVYVDGQRAAVHTGGYDGFSVRLSESVSRQASSVHGASFELLVHVFNPAEEGVQPQGKGFIKYIDNVGPFPAHIYGPTSGIWQTQCGSRRCCRCMCVTCAYTPTRRRCARPSPLPAARPMRASGRVLATCTPLTPCSTLTEA